MKCYNMLLVLVFLLIVNCAIAIEQKCENGNCTVGIDANDASKNVTSPVQGQEVMTHDVAPSGMPTAMNMLAEDDYHPGDTSRPFTSPSVFVTASPLNPTVESHKGRAINFTSEEQHAENGLSSNSTAAGDSHGDKDLSDVSMDDEEDEIHKLVEGNNQTLGICIKGGLTYSNGEKIEDGCDTVCTCMAGKMDCVDRCSTPFIRKGKAITDPLCKEKAATDPCCSVLVCAADIETEPLEMCAHQNRTYQRGEKFNDGCSQVCICEAAGKVSCKPRCPPVNKTSDRCVEVQNPADSCCKMVLCDVSLDDHEHQDKDQDVAKVKLMSAKFVNASRVVFKFDSKLDDSKSTLPQVELSADKQTWQGYRVSAGGFIDGVKSDVKYARLENTDDYIVIQNTNQLMKNHDGKKESNVKTCVHNGETHKLGEEFYDGCTSFCKCLDTGVKCLKIECPTYFGLDVVDPNCIEWETEPKEFVPVAPNCCPEKVNCKSNGSCLHEGVTYQNWQELPINTTGCDKRCYCEMGKVECQSACPPVTAAPPTTLPCPNHQAILSHLPDDDCCLAWICSTPDEPPSYQGFPNIPGYQTTPDDINVQQVEAIDGQTVRLIFMVSSLIVGLHGRVEVRYTNKLDDNLSNWDVQVFAPPNDLIATQQLEFDLIGLQPNTEYRIKITVMLRDLHNTPTSRIYSVRTPAQVAPVTTLPPMIPIEPNLAVTDVNSTWANVAWRKLNDFELQFVDGVQLRFKEIEGKVYAATPLIHRAVTSYILENLKPNTDYEAGIFFIPFAGQMTELTAERKINFSTGPENDPYGFNVTLEIQQIKATTVEVSWSGVPYPEDKYVNIYRAIYQSDSGKGDFSTFKIAKRDSPTKTTIVELKPGTRYRLWLEVYLTSGKIKTSNVQDFITKPRSAPALQASTHQGKLLSDDVPDHSSDYYGPLVVVAILAAIAILSTLILLMILVKRHTQNKAAISSNSRISQSAYDNPTYKVEIQQETMGL